MPSFFPRTYPKTSPLSPPNHKQAYTSITGGVPVITQMPYVPQTTHPSRDMATYDLDSESYGQPAVFAASCPMMFQAQSLQQPTYNGFPPPGLTHPTNRYGAHNSANILPPLRNNDRSAAHRPSAHQSEATHPDPIARKEPPKEDKALGGVAAHLDYEMDQMSDYVSEMAQGMYALYASKICLADIDILRSVQPKTPVSPAFRKFVSQILSSTRLPSSTILLGLFYLSTRMSMLSQSGQHKTSSGQVYRMLTIALLLGSKFLDDNTFQNRSWSEVTGLNVRELNTLEVEWLVAIDWDLHIDLHKHTGFMTWRSHWERWSSKAAERSLGVFNHRLGPIDASTRSQSQRVHQHLSTFATPLSMLPTQYPKPTGPNPTPDRHQQATRYQAPVHFESNNWAYSRSHERSPPSAPETGPNTPEYYGPQSIWLGQRGTSNGYHGVPQQAQQPQSHHQQPQTYSAHGTPFHHGAQFTAAPPAYLQNIWSSHGAGCGCLYCLRSSEPSYFTAGIGGMPLGYGPPQTVMG